MKKCTLILKDEVNAKIAGLDADTRRKCSAALKFFQPGARYSYAYKMGRWDGRISFFNAVNGETFINLLDRTIPIIEEAGYDIEIEDHRPEFNVTFDPIDGDFLSDITWPEGHRFAGQSVVLQEHQVRIINALLQEHHALVEAATGAGKCIGFDTEINLIIDETTPFGQFLLNKVEIATGAGKDEKPKRQVKNA